MPTPPSFRVLTELKYFHKDASSEASPIQSDRCQYYGEKLAKGATILFGRKYNYNTGKDITEQLRTITQVALAVILFPITLIGGAIGCATLYFSESHKKQFAILLEKLPKVTPKTPDSSHQDPKSTSSANSSGTRLVKKTDLEKELEVIFPEFNCDKNVWNPTIDYKGLLLQEEKDALSELFSEIEAACKKLESEKKCTAQSKKLLSEISEEIKIIKDSVLKEEYPLYSQYLQSRLIRLPDESEVEKHICLFEHIKALKDSSELTTDMKKIVASTIIPKFNSILDLMVCPKETDSNYISQMGIREYYHIFKQAKQILNYFISESRSEDGFKFSPEDESFLMRSSNAISDLLQTLREGINAPGEKPKAISKEQFVKQLKLQTDDCAINLIQGADGIINSKFKEISLSLNNEKIEEINVRIADLYGCSSWLSFYQNNWQEWSNIIEQQKRENEEGRDGVETPLSDFQFQELQMDSHSPAAETAGLPALREKQEAEKVIESLTDQKLDSIKVAAETMIYTTFNISFGDPETEKKHSLIMIRLRGIRAQIEGYKTRTVGLTAEGLYKLIVGIPGGKSLAKDIEAFCKENPFSHGFNENAIEAMNSVNEMIELLLE